MIAFRDTSEVRTMAEQMAHLAQHDYLTGLPNRMLLSDRLSQAISYAKRHGTQLAILFLDLDNFKHINDSLGHLVGDKLLESVSQRLLKQVRESETVSRQGGDEFLVLLLLEDSNVKKAAITAEKIIQSLAECHYIDCHELYITTSIGISLFPIDASDPDELIKTADIAMYAKKNGRNNYQFFTEDMNNLAVDRQTIEADLRRAISREEFILHYQEKVNLKSGEIVGAEALVRWIHPTKGTILPESFIAIAEDCGLIIPIGRLVLRQACEQAKKWVDQGMRITIAVNISALEFQHRNFLECVRMILRETDLNPQFLQIELTESILMQNVESSGSTLQVLKDIGVQIAVDDFGTGYSSLSYLSQFPIDVLKIDQSFIRNISSNASNGIIVNAVIGIGASLKQIVIAEGIETQEELSFLNAHHCDEGQGYLFGYPQFPNDFAKKFLGL